MRYEPGKSYAWFLAYGRGYLAVYAYPGNRRTRYLRHPDGKPVQFDTYLEAIEAAQLQVRKVCERDITSTAEPDEKKVAEVLDVAGWKADRAKERAEQRKIYRPGKKAIVVERRRG